MTRHPRSLRARIVLIASLLVAAVSAVIGTVSVTWLHSYLLGQVDLQLAVSVHRAGTVPPPGTAPGPPRDPSEFVGLPGQPPRTVTAVFRDGTFEVGGWVNSQGVRHELEPAARQRLSEVRPGRSPETIQVGGEVGALRVAARPAEGGGVVVVGAPLGAVDGATERLGLIFVLVGGAGVLLAVGFAAWAMGRELAPLRRVAASAATVTELPLERGEVHLAERVDATDLDSSTEVGRVGTALNDLLDHVEHALVQREASESTMRRFVADASHELRTPLSVIRAYAQLSAAPGTDPAQLRDNAAMIDSESGRMARLVNDLLALARLDAIPELAEEPLDLGLLTAERTTAARTSAPDHAWELTLDDRPAMVRGDASMLARVVDNLLGNAAKHTPVGSTVSVIVAVDPGAPVVRLTVSDSGSGIPEGSLAGVFDRFARGDGARNRDSGSTGLGLAIARATVEAHGGTISAANLEPAGSGARFTVELPIAAPHS